MSLLAEVYSLLENTGELLKQYKPHQLQGKLKGIWEAHITSDWLILWDKNDKELILYLLDTGSHADLYKK